MFLFLFLNELRAIEFCVYISSNKGCDPEATQIHIETTFNQNLLDLSDKIVSSNNITFKFLDSISSQYSSEYFNYLKIPASSTLSLIGVGSPKTIIFNSLFNFLGDINIILENITITEKKTHAILRASSLKMKRTKFEDITVSSSDVHTDIYSLSNVTVMATPKITINCSDSDTKINAKTKFKSDSFQVELNLIGCKGDMVSGCQFHGFRFELVNSESTIQLIPERCTMIIKVELETPNATLKLYKYLSSQTVFQSILTFKPKHELNVVSEYFPAFNEFYDLNIESTHPVNFYSHSDSNLVKFVLHNTNANFYFQQNSSSISEITARNTSISFNFENPNSELVINSINVNNSNVYSNLSSIIKPDKFTFRSSNFRGSYLLPKATTNLNDENATFENVLFNNDTLFSSTDYGKSDGKPFIFFDNLTKENEYNNRLAVMFYQTPGVDKTFNHQFCSKSELLCQVFHNETFVSQNSIKDYKAICVHENDSYCINYNFTQRYSKGCCSSPDLKNIGCNTEAFRPITKLSYDEISEKNLTKTEKFTLFIGDNMSDSLDLSYFTSSLVIDFKTNKKFTLKLSKIKSLTINNGELDLEADKIENCYLQNATITSHKIVKISNLYMDQRSEYNAHCIKADKIFLNEISPKRIICENDSIFVDQFRFTDTSVKITSNMSWNTMLKIRSPACQNLSIDNNQQNSILEIDSVIGDSPSFPVSPGGTVTFINVSGKIPIEFIITNDTQFIIPDIFTIKLPKIDLKKKLDILLDKDVYADEVFISSNNATIGKGKIIAKKATISSKSFLQRGNLVVSDIKVLEDAYALINLHPPEDPFNLEVYFSGAKVPYLLFGDPSKSLKGKITLKNTDTTPINLSRIQGEFNVDLVCISNSSCKNWKLELDVDKNSGLSAKCIKLDNDQVCMNIVKSNKKTWLKYFLITLGIVLFITLIILSVYIYAKMKRRRELKILNKIFDEKSIDTITHPINEDEDDY